MVMILRSGLQVIAMVVLAVDVVHSFVPTTSHCFYTARISSNSEHAKYSRPMVLRQQHGMGFRELAMRKGPPKKVQKDTAKGFSRTASRKTNSMDPSQPESSDSDASAKTIDMLKHAANNLFLISAQIQNPELYSASWTDNARIAPESSLGLVASRDVDEGEIISLYPIHAIGIHSLGSARTRKEFMVFDADRDKDYFTSPHAKGHAVDLDARGSEALSDAKGYRHDVPMLDERNLFHSTMGTFHQGVFLDVNPSRASHPGWVAHLCSEAGPPDKDAGEEKKAQADAREGRTEERRREKEESGTESTATSANAILVPLIGAEPFAALVALRPTANGQPLFSLSRTVSNGTSNAATAMVKQVAKKTALRYQAEIAELRSYLRQAYPAEEEREQPVHVDDHADDATGTPLAAGPAGNLKGTFHGIDRSYPGLRVLHSDPDILAIPHFLTDDECDRLVAKASPHMVPCVTKNPRTGAVERDPARTSSNANVPQAEIPTVVEKLRALTRCEASQLETLQVLRYRAGQEFQVHTDGFQGPVTACGYEDSGRVVTAFCYLNDVERGGETRFPLLDLSIKPTKGTAIVHFPATVELEEDERTEHAGAVAEDEKWVIATWVWKHARSDARYAEENLPKLSDETI